MAVIDGFNGFNYLTPSQKCAPLLPGNEKNIYACTPAPGSTRVYSSTILVLTVVLRNTQYIVPVLRTSLAITLWFDSSV